jgi:hypothetical protein
MPGPEAVRPERSATGPRPGRAGCQPPSSGAYVPKLHTLPSMSRAM